MVNQPMAAGVARLALLETGLTQVMELLAYVEGFALVVGSLGLGLHPPRIVGHVGDLVLTGKRPWAPHCVTFPAHLRAVAREVLIERLRLEAVTRTPAGLPTEEVRMAVAQVGGVAGVATLAHAAGELMTFVRSDDAAMVTAAVVVCDVLRADLERCARADVVDDTARCAAPPDAEAPPRAADVQRGPRADGEPR